MNSVHTKPDEDAGMNDVVEEESVEITIAKSFISTYSAKSMKFRKEILFFTKIVYFKTHFTVQFLHMYVQYYPKTTKNRATHLFEHAQTHLRTKY